MLRIRNFLPFSTTTISKKNMRQTIFNLKKNESTYPGKVRTWMRRRWKSFYALNFAPSRNIRILTFKSWIWNVSTKGLIRNYIIPDEATVKTKRLWKETIQSMNHPRLLLHNFRTVNQSLTIQKIQGMVWILEGKPGTLSTPGFRIRIHLIRTRIRIQRLRLETNPDPDPIRIQGFNDQKLKKNYSWKKIKFIFPKTAIYLSLGLHKVCPSYRRSLQLSKEAIQHFKTWTFTNFFLLLWVIFALLDPNPDPDSESGSETLVYTVVWMTWGCILLTERRPSLLLP